MAAAQDLTGLVSALNSKFAELDQGWVEAVLVRGLDGLADRVKVSVTEAARSSWKEDKNRQPPSSTEGVAALTAYLNEQLSAHSPSLWVTCGVDSEIYFASRGALSVVTPSGPAPEKPLLRYWASRGRAQGLRYLLSDVLGVDGWQADELSFDRAAEWKGTLKADSGFSGAWHTLPVVRLPGGPLVGQTEAAARYLGAKFGVAGSNIEEATVADSLLCATYQAVTTVSMKTLYAADEETFNKELQQLHTTYPPYLASLTEILGDKDYFVSPTKPLYADYFVLDALQHVREFLGLSFLSPPLLAFLQRMEARPNIAAQIAKTPAVWCYSPNEPANWEKIRAQLKN